MVAQTDREQFIKDNIGLVHSCAHKLTGRGTEYDDLFQAGCVGLIKAVDGFDESKGFSFSTYAVPVILGEIKRIFRDGGTVKVSRSLKDKARKIMREREIISKKTGREPTIAELSDASGLSLEETSEAINAAMPVLSLTFSDESNDVQLDIPVDSPDEKVSESIALKQLLNKLGEKDRQLIILRYFNCLTQSKTAEKLSMSQVQVSRREKIILQKLRNGMLE